METKVKNIFSLNEILKENNIQGSGENHGSTEIDPELISNFEKKDSFISKLTGKLSYFFQDSFQKEEIKTLKKKLETLQKDRDFLEQEVNLKISNLKESLLDKMQAKLKVIESKKIDPIYKDITVSGVVVDTVIDDEAINKVRNEEEEQINFIRSRMNRIKFEEPFDPIGKNKSIQEQFYKITSDFSQKVEVINTEIELAEEEINSFSKKSAIKQSLFSGAEVIKKKGIEAEYIVPTSFIKVIEQRKDFYYLKPDSKTFVDVYYPTFNFYKKNYKISWKERGTAKNENTFIFSFIVFIISAWMLVYVIQGLSNYLVVSLVVMFSFIISLAILLSPLFISQKIISKRKVLSNLKPIIGGRNKKEYVGKLKIQTPPLHCEILKNRLRKVKELGIKTYLVVHRKGFSFNEDELISILKKEEVRREEARQAELRRQRMLAMDPIICHDLGEVSGIEMTAIIGSYGDIPEEQKVIDELVEKFGNSHFYMNTPQLNLN